jgi:transcriptional regulator with XRE-family HTH domain
MHRAQSLTRGAAAPSFGLQLKQWRTARRLSQLDLALEAGVSARHVSFLETDRARPSREMVERLASTLTLPRPAVNELLLSAGYAPAFPASTLTSEALAPMRAIMTRLMQQHAPFPALLCDRAWTLLDANQPARALLAPLQPAGDEPNVIRMMMGAAADGLVENKGDVAEEMLSRLRLERLSTGPDAQIDGLIGELERWPALSGHTAGAAPRPSLCPIHLKVMGRRLSFLSAIVQFGTSEDITVRDLRLELLYPADEATRTALTANATGILDSKTV